MPVWITKKLRGRQTISTSSVIILYKDLFYIQMCTEISEIWTHLLYNLVEFSITTHIKGPVFSFCSRCLFNVLVILKACGAGVQCFILLFKCTMIKRNYSKNICQGLLVRIVEIYEQTSESVNDWTLFLVILKCIIGLHGT